MEIVGSRQNSRILVDVVGLWQFHCNGIVGDNTRYVYNLIIFLSRAAEPKISLFLFQVPMQQLSQKKMPSKRDSRR